VIQGAKRFFSQIEGVIFIFFIVRIYGITFPPLETWHSWRQGLTNMMARNIYRGEGSLMYPTVDMTGSNNPVIASEFPFFQYLIARMHALFGYSHWNGRLLNLIVCSIGIWCFFQLISRWFSRPHAWASVIILLSSLWFAFSRKVMPDTFACSLVIIGFYALSQLFCIAEQEKNRIHVKQQILVSQLFYAILSFLFLALGGLCKIPVVFLFALAPLIFMYKKVDVKLRIAALAIIGIASVPILVWYFIHLPNLLENGAFVLFFPHSISEGLTLINNGLKSDFFMQFYFGSLRSYVGFGAFLVSLCWIVYTKKWRLFCGFIICLVSFSYFAIGSGNIFPTHNYYVLPFVPVMAFFAGYGLSKLSKRWKIVFLVLIIAEGIGNQLSDFQLDENVLYRLQLSKELNSILPIEHRIVVLAGSNPEMLYWFDRKGWSMEPTVLQNPDGKRELLRQGAKYVVVQKGIEELPISLLKIRESTHLSVYSLR
jgi:hypothetical protein